MTAIIDISIDLFIALITFFSQDLFFVSFSERKKQVIANVLWIISFFVLFISSCFVNNWLASLFILAVCVFAASFKYDFKHVKRLGFTLLFVFVFVLADLVAGLFIEIVFSADSFDAHSIEYYLTALLPKLLAFIFFFIIRAFNVLILKIVRGVVDSSVNESKLGVAEEIIKRQTEQYDMLLRNNEEIMKLKHDYRNFIIGILTEMKNQNYKTIEERLAEQVDTLSEFSGSSISGNSIIDTVLSYKISYAKAKNIDVLFKHKNLHNIYVSGIDMAILLGNVLDNAIEAVEQIEPQELRYIEVFAQVKNTQIFITVKNPVKNNVDVDNLQTSKKNSFSHGYGILNMRSIAKKYGGSVTFDCQKNVFGTYIIIENINE